MSAPEASPECCVDKAADEGHVAKATCGACASFVAAWDLMRRNKQMTLVLVAAGLQNAASGIADILVVGVLRGQHWSQQMAEYGAYVGILMNIFGAVCGGPFGRLSDTIDRRIAFALSGVLTMLPTLTLLVFGFNGFTSLSLLLNTVVRIVCTVGYTSNIGFVLANDITDFHDRELMSGLFNAVNNLMQIVLTGIPALLTVVLQVVDPHPVFMLYVSLGMNALFFVLVFMVRAKPNQNEAEEKDQVSGSGELAASPPAASAGSKKFSYSKGGACSAITEPVTLMFTHRRLRRLILALFLMGLCDNLTMAVGGQFYYQQLNLIPYGTQQQMAMVNVCSTLPGQIMVLPGLILCGYLAQQRGALRLTRQLLPLAAISIAFSCTLAFIPQLWWVVIIVAVKDYSFLPRVPIMRMVAGVAPPGRMGEAISAAGIVSQLAGLVGNGLVAVLGHVFAAMHMADPLWLYFVAGGFLTLLALLPLLGQPKNGWGVAAGRLDDFTAAVVMASVATSRWKGMVKRNKAERMSSALAPDEAKPEQPQTSKSDADVEQGQPACTLMGKALAAGRTEMDKESLQASSPVGSDLASLRL